MALRRCAGLMPLRLSTLRAACLRSLFLLCQVGEGGCLAVLEPDQGGCVDDEEEDGRDELREVVRLFELRYC